MKLQKLFYCAQGGHVAAHGTKLFSEKIVAWTHGPVVREVYFETKGYGRNPIDADAFISDDYADISEIDAWAEGQEIEITESALKQFFLVK